MKRDRAALWLGFVLALLFLPPAYEKEQSQPKRPIKIYTNEVVEIEDNRLAAIAWAKNDAKKIADKEWKISVGRNSKVPPGDPSFWLGWTVSFTPLNGEYTDGDEFIFHDASLHKKVELFYILGQADAPVRFRYSEEGFMPEDDTNPLAYLEPVSGSH